MYLVESYVKQENIFMNERNVTSLSSVPLGNNKLQALLNEKRLAKSKRSVDDRICNGCTYNVGDHCSNEDTCTRTSTWSL